MNKIIVSIAKGARIFTIKVASKMGANLLSNMLVCSPIPVYRMSIMGSEMLRSNALTILYPAYFSHIKLLHSLSMGRPTIGRMSSCTRILYARPGKDMNKREATTQCGLYEKDASVIDGQALCLIDNGISQDELVFQAIQPDILEKGKFI